MARKPPAIVAELGRPETPEEAAERKAAASARRRSNQTALNLVIATVASLLIVAFLVVVVVRPAPAPTEPIDFGAIAAETGAGVVAPELPSTWRANDARFETTQGVRTWYIGFITPETQFIALNQGLDANPTWLAATLEDARATGTTRIAGLEWTVYDRRDSGEPGNHAFALSTEVEGSTIVLHGTADDAEFAALAESVAAELEDR